MSLINEALKKAQRQRTLDQAPLTSAPSGVAAAAVTTHVATATHRRRSQLGWALALITVGAGIAYVVLRFTGGEAQANVDGAVPAVAESTNSPTATTVAPPTAPPVAQAKPNVAVAPEMAVVAFPAPSATTQTGNVPSAIQQAPTPEAARVVEPTVVAPAVVVVAPVSPPEKTIPPPPILPPPPPVVKADPVVKLTPVVPIAVAPNPLDAARQAERLKQIRAFLDTLRVTGVRGSGREARVLINERVWRAGDVLSDDLGLRLTAVRPGELVFTDTEGREHVRAR